MGTQAQARPVTNGRPVQAQSQPSELDKLKAENAALKAAAEAAQVSNGGGIVAEDNGTYGSKDTPMVLISGFGGRPINKSYKHVARVAYAAVAGHLNALPEFATEWNALVAEFGDPSGS